MLSIHVEIPAKKWVPLSSCGISVKQVFVEPGQAAGRTPGAITSFAAGFMKIRWALWSKLVIAVVTATQAGLVFLLYSSHDIWPCYLAFGRVRVAYQFLVPIATFQIASSLSKELCALVFGVNTFLATVLKTIITLIVSDKRGLSLSVRSQFLVYFVYFLVLCGIYFTGAMLDLLHYLRQKHHQPLPLAPELRSPAEKTMQALGLQDRDLSGLQPLAPPPLEHSMEDSTRAPQLASPEEDGQDKA
ncbi:Folate transporter 1 [Tupaia chinensis]|uniref:Folate transporter 1 n=1 Tax=Tupaia chinensis TaxID=246437 RepID=L8Y5I0_TUPCH|nr:Folate transporter 1 [Tupaia chinensis]